MTISTVPDLDTLVASYDRDGLALVEGVLDPPTRARAAAGVEWAMAHVQGQYCWIKQFTYAWREHPVFLELITHPLVMQFARAVLGEDFHLIAAQCSRNTREDHYAPGTMQIHQDAVFFPAAERRPQGVADHRVGFSAMWHVQDTPLDMGPTELVIGSHRYGQRALSNADLDAAGSAERLFRRDLPAGSLLIFSHRTWHRGAPNRTDRPRDLITNAYAGPAVAKVQLTSKGADGVERYVEPADLLAGADLLVRQLLRAPWSRATPPPAPPRR